MKSIRILLSMILACCISGLYLILYAFHLFNQVDAIYVPEHRVQWVIENPQTLVKVDPIPLIAQDTYWDIEEEQETTTPVYYIGVPLTASRGVCKGPSGKETWYNLPMDRVVKTMRDRGYTENNYPYFIRDDGVKTLGGYVMVAADLDKYNKGDLVATTLGMGIVCDTGDFTDTTDIELDIATNW